MNAAGQTRAPNVPNSNTVLFQVPPSATFFSVVDSWDANLDALAVGFLGYQQATMAPREIVGHSDLMLLAPHAGGAGL